MKIAILIGEATRAERGAASEGEDALRPFVFVDKGAGPDDLEGFKFVEAEVEHTRGTTYDGEIENIVTFIVGAGASNQRDVSQGSELVLGPTP
jgi:hypothetical protein